MRSSVILILTLRKNLLQQEFVTVAFQYRKVGPRTDLTQPIDACRVHLHKVIVIKSRLHLERTLRTSSNHLACRLGNMSSCPCKSIDVCDVADGCLLPKNS